MPENEGVRALFLLVVRSSFFLMRRLRELVDYIRETVLVGMDCRNFEWLASSLQEGSCCRIQVLEEVPLVNEVSAAGNNIKHKKD